MFFKSKYFLNVCQESNVASIIYYHFLEKEHKVGFNLGHLKQYFDMMVQNEAPKKQTNIKLNESKPVVSLKKENGINQKKAKDTIELEEEEMEIENEKYFFCTLCKIDIYQKTEAYDHLGEF